MSCIKQTKDTCILYNEYAQDQDAEWDTDITIKNIVFDGTLVNAKSEYSACIFMCDVCHLKIDGCSVKDIGGDGIYLGRGGCGTK